MFANEDIETISRKEIQELQLERLKKEIKWACSKSSFYQKKFKEAGIGVPVIDTLDDLSALPCTSLQEMISVSPFDMLAVPLNSVMRMSQHGQSKAFVKMYTKGDIARNSELATRLLVANGINSASRVAILWDMSDSRVMDMQYALELIGATVIVLGSDMDKAIAMLNICQPDALISDLKQVTQLMVQMQANAHSEGMIGVAIDMNSFGNEFKVPIVFCMEENIHNPMRSYIERRLGAKVLTTYNSPDMGCSSILFPCEAAKGFHVQEDCYYPELLDLSSGEVIKEPSHVGELLLTTLVAEAMPIIRYKTGQTAMYLDGDCSCGRGFVRLATPMEYFASF